MLMASMASAAHAAVGFEFGAQFYNPRIDPNGAGLNWNGVGQSFAVTWGIDGGMTLGAYAEATDLNDGYGNTYPFTVQAISIAKDIVKSASIGLRIGSFYEDYNGVSGLLTDIAATLTLLQGGGDRVNGAVLATAGGRFADNSNSGGEDWSGYFVNLAVAIRI
jgi:hypothetical protein